MPAFSPTIGKFGDVTARGKPWTRWYKRHKPKLLPVFSTFILLIFIIGGWWLWQGQMVPAAGGTLDEGMVGQPQRLNPLYSSQNDVDAEITPLIFRGLMKYDSDFNLVNDLASDIHTDNDETTYTVTLADAQWHDGAKVTAHDVAFTIKATQDPDYKGPWSGSFANVSLVIIDEKTIELTLDEPYAPFKHNLTIGLLPEHLLNGMSSQQLATDEFNLSPVGTGVLKFDSIQPNQDGGIATMKFVLTSGYIGELAYHFYQNYDEAITDFKLGRLDSFGTTYAEGLSVLGDFDHKQSDSVLMGQSYGLYFNLTQESVEEVEVREALAAALNKERLLPEVFKSYASQMTSIYHPTHWAHSSDVEPVTHDLDRAQRLWNKADNPPDSIRLLVPDRSVHVQLAEKIANDWSQLGVEISIEAQNSSEVAQTVQTGKGYDVALLGERMRHDPDRYSNWHSTQAPPIGLNVSRLQNDRVDKALEDARILADIEERKIKYATFQDYLSRDVPVIWLYQPHYIYMWGNKLHGIQLGSMWSESDRYSTLEKWYVNQQRRQ